MVEAVFHVVCVLPQLTGSLQQHKETFMTQLQMELSDHTDDIKTVRYVAIFAEGHK